MIKLVTGAVIIASILLIVIAVGYGVNCLGYKELIPLRDLDSNDYTALVFDGLLTILAVFVLGGLSYMIGSYALGSAGGGM